MVSQAGVPDEISSPPALLFIGERFFSLSKFLIEIPHRSVLVMLH